MDAVGQVASMPVWKPNDDRGERSLPVPIGLVIVIAIACVPIEYGIVRFVDITVNYPTEGDYDHAYLVEVYPNNTEPYTLMLPVPVNEAGVPPPGFLEDLALVAGMPSVALASTTHGLALEISGTGFVRIEWDQSLPKSSGIRHSNLSMTVGSALDVDDERVRSWIYSDSDDLRIRLFYDCIHVYMYKPWYASGGGPEYSLWVYPAGDGWQQVEIDAGWLVIN